MSYRWLFTRAETAPWSDVGGDFDADKVISSKLRIEFDAWNGTFLASLIGAASHCAILDWESFHAKGMAIARCLMVELGVAMSMAVSTDAGHEICWRFRYASAGTFNIDLHNLIPIYLQLFSKHVFSNSPN